LNAVVTPISPSSSAAPKPAPGRRVRPIEVESQRILTGTLASLKAYFDDPAVSEIMVNSPDSVFVERQGKMFPVEATFTDAQIESCLHAIMRLNSKEITPIMDARLAGLRVAAALPPIAIHGPMIVIRKHASRRFPLDEYVEQGAFTRLRPDQIAGESASEEMQREMEAAAAVGGAGLEAFLRWAVLAHKNILVVGGTSSGKTTFLSSLLLEIPASERIITCEDTHEIIVEQPNVLQLEGWSNPDPLKAVTIRDLIRLCLRSRPDRIIVGEVRGPEAYDFLDSMNTGHSGSIGTLHADSALQGLARLESLIRMSPTAANLPLVDMRTQIATAINYVVFQSRLGGKRGPQQVLSLQGVDDSGHYVAQTIFNRLSTQE